MTDQANAAKRLKGMLARIFSDGVLEERERKELSTLVGSLDAETVRATMTEFVKRSFEHAKADGVVTAREEEKLRLIVKELALPPDCLPDELRKLVAGG